MRGRVVTFKLRGQPARVRWRKGVIQRRRRMRSHMVQHHANFSSMWKLHIDQCLQLVRKVRRGPLRWYFDVPPALVWLEADEQVARAGSLVLVVHARRLS